MSTKEKRQAVDEANRALWFHNRQYSAGTSSPQMRNLLTAMFNFTASLMPEDPTNEQRKAFDYVEYCMRCAGIEL